jgi:hypothetical protein
MSPFSFNLTGNHQYQEEGWKVVLYFFLLIKIEGFVVCWFCALLLLL